MKTNYLFIAVFLFLTQVVFAQNDTITGILLDINNKAIKNYPVTLGSVSPVTVKTNKNGIFIFPDANLRDTLFVADKKGKNAVAIPVNGSPFIAIKSQKGDLNTEYLSEPDEQFVRYLQQMEKDRKKNLNTLTKEDIQQSGCRDVRCLLTRFSGVIVHTNGEITMRGSTSSLQGSSSALIVLDGISGASIDSVAIDDIETISVLRDASIYGVRGANGAIVINTRRR